mmetsp:Transcript_31434/g.96122  ORF Transcript_31434/g.96122 Transcript_31434/m.96122 type:complete len:312 (+) Transcript_31434:129-1064(+)
MRMMVISLFAEPLGRTLAGHWLTGVKERGTVACTIKAHFVMLITSRKHWGGNDHAGYICLPNPKIEGAILSLAEGRPSDVTAWVNGSATLLLSRGALDQLAPFVPSNGNDQAADSAALAAVAAAAARFHTDAQTSIACRSPSITRAASLARRWAVVSGSGSDSHDPGSGGRGPKAIGARLSVVGRVASASSHCAITRRAIASSTSTPIGTCILFQVGSGSADHPASDAASSGMVRSLTAARRSKGAIFTTSLSSGRRSTHVPRNASSAAPRAVSRACFCGRSGSSSSTAEKKSGLPPANSHSSSSCPGTKP